MLSLHQASDFLSARYEKKTVNTALVLCVNIASFIALSLVAFRANEHSLFLGLDGSYMMTIVKQQLTWSFPQFGFISNFHQSLGNVSFPLNSYWIPGYFLSAFMHSGTVNPVVSYTIFAVELFIATTCLGLYLHRSPVLAVATAWVFCLVVFPYGLLYHRHVRLYTIMDMVPNLATFMTEVIFISILFYMVGRRRWPVTVICGVAILLLLIHIVLAQPTAMILLVPAVFMIYVFSLFQVHDRVELGWKLGVALFIISAILLSGCATYIYGVFKYTAAAFFEKEFFNDRMQILYVSVAFSSLSGLMLCVLAVVGSIVALWRGSDVVRAMAGAILAAVAIIIVFGLITISFDVWHGPSPLYFEFALWPFYAVYGAIAVRFVMGFMASVKHRIFLKFHTGTRALPSRRSWDWIGWLSVAILPWFLILPLLLVRPGHASPSRNDAYPPVKTAVVQYLAENIGLTPGRIFQGRVATLTGQKINHPINWLDLHIMDVGLVRRLGNDHRMVGLWYYDIPTLFEYSSLITPPFYLITRHFFERTGDRQLRSVMTLRRSEPTILRMMGIRYIITDAPIASDANLRCRIPRDGVPELLLYELENVNVGQFSPTGSVVRADAPSALTAMSQADFDPARVVVVQAPLPDHLVPLTSSQIRVERGQLRISAVSKGRSVMLLPVEYSHCLDLTTDEKETTPPLLFRADLLQTGVLFSGKLNGTLKFFTGPFQNAGCRLEDIDDMKRMNVAAEQVIYNRDIKE